MADNTRIQTPGSITPEPPGLRHQSLDEIVQQTVQNCIQKQQMSQGWGDSILKFWDKTKSHMSEASLDVIKDELGKETANKTTYSIDDRSGSTKLGPGTGAILHGILHEYLGDLPLTGKDNSQRLERQLDIVNDQLQSKKAFDRVEDIDAANDLRNALKNEFNKTEDEKDKAEDTAEATFNPQPKPPGVVSGG